MNELGIVVAMSIAAILWAAMSYSVGYREGQREGFKRGRAVSRHGVKVALERGTYTETKEVK